MLAETNFGLVYAKSRFTTSESEVTIAKRVYTFVATRCKKSPKKAFSIQRARWTPTTTTSRCWRPDVQDADLSMPGDCQPSADRRDGEAV
jgi:hypothetical protein